MKYQVQQYRPDNHEDRSVVATSGKITGETDAKNWYENQITFLQKPEGFEFAMVPENHQWFEVQIDESVAATNKSLESFGSPQLLEGEPVRFEDVCKHELERNQKDRIAQHEAEMQGY